MGHHVEDFSLKLSCVSLQRFRNPKPETEPETTYMLEMLHPKPILPESRRILNPSNPKPKAIRTNFELHKDKLHKDKLVFDRSSGMGSRA